MKLITLRSQILEVAKKWKRQYGDGRYGEDKLEILKELKSLNLETATPEEVEDIIGNSSWACPQRCNECNAKFDEVVEMGEEPDYESSTARICRGCLEKALKLFK